MVLKVEKLSQHYGSRVALDAVSFQVGAGCTGLLGPNGAGKSTLIKALLGWLPLGPGQVRVLGEDPARRLLSVRQRVGYMAEDEVALPGLSGMEFVAMCGALCGMRIKDATSRAHRMLDFVGLGESRYRTLDGYSTGMKQRAKLAAALVHGPELLLLDEPTSGLDPAGREEMLVLVGSLGKRGVSVLLSSHILRDIEKTCESVVVLNQGRLVYAGTRQGFQQEEGPRILLRVKQDRQQMAEALRARGCKVSDEVGALGLEVVLPPDAELALLWQVARQEGLQVRNLMPAGASLERAYTRRVEGMGQGDA